MEQAVRAGKPLIVFLMAFGLVTTFLSCVGPVDGNIDGDDDAEFEDVEFYGTALKGPFRVGSSVNVYELQRPTLDQTGISFSGDIANDAGDYSISARMRPGPVEVVTTGRFFHEVRGENTSGTLTLRAVTENTGSVNVNVLTAIERDRVRRLVNDQGLTFEAAKRQALEELFDVFDVIPEAEDTTRIEIDSTDGKMLLMVSSIIATDVNGEARSVGDIQSLITNMRTDFVTGELSESTLNIMGQSAEHVDHDAVHESLNQYYNSIDAQYDLPSFVTELNNFANQYYDGGGSDDDPDNGTEYSIGQQGPGGGFVFYDKGEYTEEWRYLELAPASTEVERQWGDISDFLGATANGLGLGSGNTSTILSESSFSESAAAYCDDLVVDTASDWYLGTREEVGEMYVLVDRGLGGIAPSRLYWTSTELDEGNAHSRHRTTIYSSGSDLADKNNEHAVRCIRSF